jgi:uncharacterized protein
MFGFSLGKLLVLAAIVAAVWYGFKYVGQLDKQRRQSVGRNDGGAPSQATKRQTTDSEDTVRCPRCGVFYVAGNPHSCDDAAT